MALAAVLEALAARATTRGALARRRALRPRAPPARLLRARLTARPWLLPPGSSWRRRSPGSSTRWRRGRPRGPHRARNHTRCACPPPRAPPACSARALRPRAPPARMPVRFLPGLFECAVRILSGLHLTRPGRTTSYSSGWTTSYSSGWTTSYVRGVRQRVRQIGFDRLGSTELCRTLELGQRVDRGSEGVGQFV